MFKVPYSLALREAGAMTHQQFQNSVKHLPLQALPLTGVCEFSRARIQELVTAAESLYIITSSAQCAVCPLDDLSAFKWISSDSERAKTVFFNRHNAGVIYIFTSSTDNISRLKCRVYPLVGAPYAIFTQEELASPGFMEFDDLNGVILTRSCSSRGIKIWDMTDYSLRYCMTEGLVDEVRLTTGLLLLVYTPRESLLNAKLLNLTDATMLNAYQFPLKRQKPIELLELFDEFLLLKQDSEHLVIFNLLTNQFTLVPAFRTPKAFVFLQVQMKFLAIRAGFIEVWNLAGEQLRDIHSPMVSNLGLLQPTKLYISRPQDLIFFCFNYFEEDQRRIVIRVLELPSGSCVAEIPIDSECSDISTFTYDEDSARLFTGHSSGAVRVWGN